MFSYSTIYNVASRGNFRQHMKIVICRWNNTPSYRRVWFVQTVDAIFVFQEIVTFDSNRLEAEGNNNGQSDVSREAPS